MATPKGTLKASELAKILEISRTAVNRRAKKERWDKIELPSLGGLTHYFIIRNIPEPTRSKIFNAIPQRSKKKMNDSKLEKAIDYLNRANEILTELNIEGYEKKEVNRILSLAKQALRVPREENVKPPKEGSSGRP